MRILLVDDESLARERLRRLIEEMAMHEVVGEADSGIQALEMIQQLHPELVLLDIRMPGMDGLEVARHLMHLDDAPAVVFCTAYDEHAIEAFKVNAVDYLMKPVRAEHLAKAINKASRPNRAQLAALSRDENGGKLARTHISARTRLGITLVPIDDVYFFRAEHKYVTVRHKGGEVLIEDPLKDLEEEFGERFIRVHRNSLAAIGYIRGLEKNEEGYPCIRFSEIPDTLDVSRRHLPKVRQMMR